MASDAGQRYTIQQPTAVIRAIHELGKKAARAGITKKFVEALKTIMAKLATEPLTWGEPRYHPKKKGSVVCQAVCKPLSIHYVVFEVERAVVILTIVGFPGTPLEQ
jgi:hypothetical protein